MNALVIGGTGMLKEATQWMIHQGMVTTAIARNKRRLEQLSQDQTNYIPISLDYCDNDELKNALRSTMDHIGAFDLVVAWIHGKAPDALDIVIDEVNRQQGKPWRLFHLKGSSASLEAIKKSYAAASPCLYRQISLGFVKTSIGSRWLTHEEISQGTIKAIQEDRDIVIGQLEPWSDRP